MQRLDGRDAELKKIKIHFILACCRPPLPDHTDQSIPSSDIRFKKEIPKIVSDHCNNKCSADVYPLRYLLINPQDLRLPFLYLII